MYGLFYDSQVARWASGCNNDRYRCVQKAVEIADYARRLKRRIFRVEECAMFFVVVQVALQTSKLRQYFEREHGPSDHPSNSAPPLMHSAAERKVIVSIHTTLDGWIDSPGSNRGLLIPKTKGK
jgi:hypothetical protein